MSYFENNLISELVGFVFFVVAFFKLTQNGWALGLTFLFSSIVYFAVYFLVNYILNK